MKRGVKKFFLVLFVFYYFGCGDSGGGIECVRDLDCGEELVCVQGRCVPSSSRVCKPGEKRCNGNNVEVCAEDGSQWIYSETCISYCLDGECGSPLCTPGEKRCNGDNVEECASTGSEWILVESCRTRCEEGECKEPVCTPGEKRCEGDDVVRCNQNGTFYEFLYHCESGCENGACVEPICEPFSTRCNENVVETCSARGREWLPSETCEIACEGGHCVTLGPGECSPAGIRRCNGNNVERCTDHRTWEIIENCFVGCMNGACIQCLPGDRQCNGNNVEVCNNTGSNYELAERCDYTCIDDRCTQCIPGERRCNNNSIEVCNSDGQGWSIVGNCITSCLNGQCTNPICAPFSTRCNGNVVQICNFNGTAWEDVQTCSVGCSNGQCITTAICVPGEKRCNGRNVEVCNPNGTEWIFYEACLGNCQNAQCVGSGCVQFTLTSSPSSILNDGSSSSLIYSSQITNVRGNPIPDGTEFTIEASGGTIVSNDVNPNLNGVQVRSVNGRIDFVVRSSSNSGTFNVTATASLNSDCRGEGTITFSPQGRISFAEDFTTTTYRDTQNTTAYWDTTLGLADPFPSDLGTGRDGALTVSSGTYNINQNGVPGRIFPDAVNFKVTEVRSNSVVVEGGVGGLERGDEVILIQMQGQGAGNYEFLTVSAINFSGREIIFNSTISNTYSTSGSGKVMVQRVPHYTDVTINGTLTADAWDGNKGGLLLFRATGRVTVNGSINMNGKGYRGGGGCGCSSWYPGEGYMGPNCSSTSSSNYGGGGGSRTYYSYSYYGYGAGGGYGTQGTNGYGYYNSGQGGESYGEENLRRLFLGAGGGNAYDSYYGYYACGGNGGGIIYIVSNQIVVSGNITANGDNGGSWGYAYGGGGAGGSIWLRARIMNVGTNRVSARGGQNYRAGGDGRIRLDYFSIIGTTTPTFYEGFRGDAIVQTVEVDSTSQSITSATILQTISQTDGGEILFEISNNSGINWVQATIGTPVTFPNVGSDLRIKITFRNRSVEPLRLMGFSISYDVRY